MSELRFNCPVCPRMGKTQDLKRHLYVNVAKHAAHCFRCGFAIKKAESFRAFILQYGLHVDLRKMVEDETETEGCWLPREFSTNFHTSVGEIALQYLLERGLNRATVGAYNIGFCAEGRYKNRIIIPIYNNLELVNWVARDWTGKQEPKYLHPKGYGKDILFNLDRAKKSPVIVLCEGVFDVLRIPEFACALLGKSCSEKQRNAILTPPRPHWILVALDADAHKEAYKVASLFEGLVPYVARLSCGGSKDLGDAPQGWITGLQKILKKTKQTYATLAINGRRPVTKA